MLIRVFSTAAVSEAKAAVHAGGIHEIHVLFETPRNSHPVDRRLQNESVRPLVFFDLGVLLVFFEHGCGLHGIAMAFQVSFGLIHQALIQFPLGEGVGLMGV